MVVAVVSGLAFWFNAWALCSIGYELPPVARFFGRSPKLAVVVFAPVTLGLLALAVLCVFGAFQIPLSQSVEISAYSGPGRRLPAGQYSPFALIWLALGGVASATSLAATIAYSGYLGLRRKRLP